jgi:hypothetical protein
MIQRLGIFRPRLLKSRELTFHEQVVETREWSWSSWGLPAGYPGSPIQKRMERPPGPWLIQSTHLHRHRLHVNAFDNFSERRVACARAAIAGQGCEKIPDRYRRREARVIAHAVYRDYSDPFGLVTLGGYRVGGSRPKLRGSQDFSLARHFNIARWNSFT